MPLGGATSKLQQTLLHCYASLSLMKLLNIADIVYMLRGRSEGHLDEVPSVLLRNLKRSLSTIRKIGTYGTCAMPSFLSHVRDRRVNPS